MVGSRNSHEVPASRPKTRPRAVSRAFVAQNHRNNLAPVVSTKTEDAMLLPEENRSTVPYLVFVSIQCSLVLLLAIPWTVQKLRNSGSIQMPTILTFQDLKPMEPAQTAHTN